MATLSVNDYILDAGSNDKDTVMYKGKKHNLPWLNVRAKKDKDAQKVLQLRGDFYANQRKSKEKPVSVAAPATPKVETPTNTETTTNVGQRAAPAVPIATVAPEPKVSPAKESYEDMLQKYSDARWPGVKPSATPASVAHVFGSQLGAKGQDRDADAVGFLSRAADFATNFISAYDAAVAAKQAYAQKLLEAQTKQETAEVKAEKSASISPSSEAVNVRWAYALATAELTDSESKKKLLSAIESNNENMVSALLVTAKDSIAKKLGGMNNADAAISYRAAENARLPLGGRYPSYWNAMKEADRKNAREQYNKLLTK
jgi:hypothetical protein